MWWNEVVRFEDDFLGGEILKLVCRCTSYKQPLTKQTRVWFLAPQNESRFATLKA